jgi:dUTP pyrophosphatase
MKIPLKILEHGLGIELPSRATPGSAGADLRAAISESVLLKRNERKLIPTGIVIALPQGCNAEVRPRSGLALKSGITVLNSPGTVDSDYRGEIKVLLINFGEEDFLIERGMRIAQLTVHKCETLEWEVTDSLCTTDRAEGGYGSTGTT